MVTLLDEPAAYVVPVLSADGGTAAWVAGSLVTVYDVPTRTPLGRTRVASAVTVVAVANDGRVGLTQRFTDGAAVLARRGRTGAGVLAGLRRSAA